MNWIFEKFRAILVSIELMNIEVHVWGLDSFDSDWGIKYPLFSRVGFMWSSVSTQFQEVPW